MSDPLARRDELEDALALAAREALAYLKALPTDPVQPPGSEDVVLDRLGGELPQEGQGALPALEELGDLARAAATRSSGRASFTSS